MQSRQQMKNTKYKRILVLVALIVSLTGCGKVSLPAMVAYCSVALDKPVLPQLCVLGSMSIGGTINRVEELASTLQVAFDAGAKRILIPMSSAADIPTVPSELFAKFQISFSAVRRMQLLRL